MGAGGYIFFFFFFWKTDCGRMRCGDGNSKVYMCVMADWVGLGFRV